MVRQIFEAMTNRSIARYGTAIVLSHLLVNIVHGAAHSELQIGLNGAETLFVALVIVTGPLVAMALLWTSRQRAGAALLAFTMAGSLLFGLYHHFVAMGPDHVAAQVPGAWGIAFVVTACLLLLIEAMGTYAGLRWFRRCLRVRPA
jgi:hypothetical protein